MLWVFLGLTIFKPVKFYFPLSITDYHNPRQRENKNQTGVKMFKAKEFLNHNI